jgi:hypothetical protein
MQPKSEKICPVKSKSEFRLTRLWRGLGDMSPSVNNNFVVIHFWDDFVG